MSPARRIPRHTFGPRAVAVGQFLAYADVPGDTGDFLEEINRRWPGLSFPRFLGRLRARRVAGAGDGGQRMIPREMLAKPASPSSWMGRGNIRPTARSARPSGRRMTKRPSMSRSKKKAASHGTATIADGRAQRKARAQRRGLSRATFIAIAMASSASARCEIRPAPKSNAGSVIRMVVSGRRASPRTPTPRSCIALMKSPKRSKRAAPSASPRAKGLRQSLAHWHPRDL